MAFDTAPEAPESHLNNQTLPAPPRKPPNTNSTASKAPEQHQQHRLESPRLARPSEPRCAPPRYARAVLASSGRDERAGPFHSHPGGWTGWRTLAAGQAGAPWRLDRLARSRRLDGPTIPCGWTSPRTRPAEISHTPPQPIRSLVPSALTHSSLARFGSRSATDPPCGRAVSPTASQRAPTAGKKTKNASTGVPRGTSRGSETEREKGTSTPIA